MVRGSSQWSARSRKYFVGRFVGELTVFSAKYRCEGHSITNRAAGRHRQRGGASDPADSADTTFIFFEPATLVGFDDIRLPIRKQSGDTCDTADSADTANPRNRAWFSVAIDRKQGGRSPRSDR